MIARQFLKVINQKFNRKENARGNNVDNGSQKYLVDQKEYLVSFRLLDFSGLGIVSTVESDKVFEAIN